jgi:hypothetical protein
MFAQINFANVRYWPKADISIMPVNVRFRGSKRTSRVRATTSGFFGNSAWGFTNVEVALYDAAQAVLKKSQFNPMLNASILGRTTGPLRLVPDGRARFRHFSKIDEPGLWRRNFARLVPRAILSVKGHRYEQGNCEVV